MIDYGSPETKAHTAGARVLAAALSSVSRPRSEVEERRLDPETCDELTAPNNPSEKTTAAEWRAKYPVWFERLAVRQLGHPSDAVRSSAAALQAVRDSFRFVRHGMVTPLGEACATRLEVGRKFDTETVIAADREHEERLARVTARAQAFSSTCVAEAEAFCARGVAERGVADAAKRIAENPAWLDCLGREFIVLGALSQMGPTLELLELGATVIAVDRADSGLQRAWRELALKASRSAGELRVPSRDGGRMGADLCEDLPELCAWLNEASGARPTICNVLYAPGESFLRVAAAADALVERLCTLKPEASLAHLSSPTEVYVVPQEAMDESARKRKERSALTLGAHQTLNAVSGGAWLIENNARVVLERPPSGKSHPWQPLGKPVRRWGRSPVPRAIAADASANAAGGALPLSDDRTYLVINSITEMQGPNYQLGKSIQRWRCIVARYIGTIDDDRDKHKHRATGNVAPASMTKSVLSSTLISAGMRGCERFGVTPFEPRKSVQWSTMLMLRDLVDPASPSNPAASLDNPMELFTHSALHGGTFRAPYETGSVTTVSGVLYLSERLVAGAALAGVALKLFTASL